MIERVLLDLDGVLVDFMDGACRLHGKTYPGHPHSPETQQDKQGWDIEPIFNMSPAELWDPMGREFWASLSPTPWMQEMVEILEAQFGEDNICILTSPVKTPGCIEGKMDWIRKYVPQYRRRFLVGPAKEFCASPYHALVDDHELNFQKFLDAGGRPFLVPAPWNFRFKEHPITALKQWIADIKAGVV